MPHSSHTRPTWQRASNRLTLWLVGLGLVSIVAVLAAVSMSRRTVLPGESFASQGAEHITEINVAHPAYNSTPPTSGWHVGRLANWGSYDFVIPDELVLHNMEDGGVILWYPYGAPDENAAHIEQLEAVGRGFERVIIAPREDLETTYALTAWQRRQTFETFDEEGMRAFLEAFEGIDHH